MSAWMLVVSVHGIARGRIPIREGMLAVSATGEVEIVRTSETHNGLLRIRSRDQIWFVERPPDSGRVVVDDSPLAPRQAVQCKHGMQIVVTSVSILVEVSAAGAKSRSTAPRADVQGESPHPVGMSTGVGGTGGGGGSRPPADPASHLYVVWYATNRVALQGNDASSWFGNEREVDGRVHYGTCKVEIPKTHRFGSVGRPWWRRWVRLEFTDDHLRCVGRTVHAGVDDFFASMQDELDLLRAEEQQVLFYLHGYKNSFESAAIRAAQIGFDLRVPGITAFFSWPSLDSVAGYVADQDRIEASEREIAEFLLRIAKSGSIRVHIIAHSMGNRGLARAVQRIAAGVADAGIRFGQVILAAPDISVDVFRELATVYPRLSERTTMYASREDRALGASGVLHAGDRAGLAPPITVVEGIDTIEVADVDVSMLGHSYFAAAEPVLYDMYELLRSNVPPTRRARLTPTALLGGATYWRMSR